MRARAVPLLLVTAGVAAGAVWWALEPTLYRAEATLVVQHGGVPATGVPRTLAALVKSDVVLANASRALTRTSAGELRSHLSASARHGALRLDYDAGSEAAAAQGAQEVASVFSVLARQRFAALDVSVFDPPRVLGRVSPHPLRDLALGLLAGLGAAAAAVAVRGRPRRQPQPQVAPAGGHTVAQLRAAADAAPAERAEELRAYAAVLASQAEDGVIPRRLEPVVAEVFGELPPPA